MFNKAYIKVYYHFNLLNNYLNQSFKKLQAMDKFMRPEKLDTDPNSSVADKEWEHWLKTFQNFVTSLTQENLNKLNLLINFVSPTVYQYISECTSYTSAIEVLKNLFIKPKNEVYARHMLACLRQQSSETLDEFIQTLRRLSKDCNFSSVTANEHAQESIRDAFISGLLSNPIRQRLLENSTLNLDDAFKQARSLEQAQKNSDGFAFQTSTVASTVDTHCIETSFGTNSEVIPVAAMSNRNNNNKCYYCGNNRHPRTSCSARDSICNKCKKNGHFAKVCKSTRTEISASILSPNILLASIGDLSQSTIAVKIGTSEYSALVDTGSTESFISSSVVRSLDVIIHPSNSVVSMASTSHQIKVPGYCTVDLVVDGELYAKTKLSVMENLCKEIILGQDFMKLHDSIHVKFGGSKPPLTICGLTAFTISPPRLFEHLSSDCKPIATKSRRYSEPDRLFIREEVKRLLKEGIVVKSSSPWRAQVLVTTNGRHKKRMVVDYSQTINRYTLLDAYPLPKIDELINKVAQYRYFSTVDLGSAYHLVPLRDDEQSYTGFEADGELYHFVRMSFGITNGVACFQRVINQFISQNSLTGTFAYLDDITICGKTKEEHDNNLDAFLKAANKYQLTLNMNKCTFSTNCVNLLGYTITNGLLKPDPNRLKPLIELPVTCDTASLRRVAGMFAYYSQWISDFSKKIIPLTSAREFPLSSEAVKAFISLKKDVADSVLQSISEDVPFVVETDASDHSIAATLNQNGRPVAFFSRTLSASERKHSAVEKEAYAIVEAIRKWRHFLTGRHFNLITDQKSVSFMFDSKQAGKIKNDKIQRWRIELSCYSFDIKYRPGKENVPADTLSRASCGAISSNAFSDLHDSLCNPSVTRMLHFVKVKNLPYSVEDVKRMTSNCPTCAKCKPQYHRPPSANLIKASTPFERLSVDFKGPLPSSTSNKYMLTIVDEFSRFPFAFPCSDMTSVTIIECFSVLFSMFGMPSYIHSDRGASFMSSEVRSFLHGREIATSRTTPYNPQGNGQCERYNGIIWRSVNLALTSRKLPVSAWEIVLPDALHSIRSLLCTATNNTPHERMFKHQRKSSSGQSMPSWLTNKERVYLKRYVKQSKYDPSVDEVELIDANPNYAHVKFLDGRESTVSLRDLAPTGDRTSPVTNYDTETANEIQILTENSESSLSPAGAEDSVGADGVGGPPVPLRRSGRNRNAADRLMYH